MFARREQGIQERPEFLPPMGPDGTGWEGDWSFEFRMWDGGAGRVSTEWLVEGAPSSRPSPQGEGGPSCDLGMVHRLRLRRLVWVLRVGDVGWWCQRPSWAFRQRKRKQRRDAATLGSGERRVGARGLRRSGLAGRHFCG